MLPAAVHYGVWYHYATMFPLRDTNKSDTFPIINWLLIVANASMFWIQRGLSGEQTEILFRTFGLVPANFTTGHPLATLGLFSSQFLHAGWLHLLSNLWTLHIFGDNVEDRMGHARYLVFYVLSGVAGGLVQVLTGPTSTIPMIGASGAIAGVLGAYIMLFPRARVLTFVPVFFLPWMVEVPAVIYLGVWFFSQFSNGMMGMSMSVSGGIAYWAHVGGFASGFVLVRSFSRHTQTVRTQPPAGNRYQSG